MRRNPNSESKENETVPVKTRSDPIRFRSDARDNSGSASGSRSGTTEEGQQSGSSRLLIVQEQIFRHPERPVSGHNREPDQGRGYEKGTDGCKEDDDYSEDNQTDERFPIRKLSTEDNDGGVGGTEEVQEQPSGEEDHEEEEREWMGEEGKREDGGDEDEVIDPEIGERVRTREGGAVEELVPWAAVGECEAYGVGESGDEGAEGRSVGCGDRGRGCPGGLRGGDRERWLRGLRRRHFGTGGVLSLDSKRCEGSG
ncbi:hypothetical protein H6P81_016771 [Aristolochia fimbriata]|uniref:Uncharacterized protein n=1 Tax=Aristolochia fimbriata TaxID=158543 RepID=A0AAV7EAI4_ARIFI|nr:hypothetical protein H6P81_016771 [Aristolochia fimbriata]